MVRIIVLLLVLLMPASALGAGICEGFSLSGLLDRVPYFAKRMSIESVTPVRAVLVHNDDPGIRTEVRFDGEVVAGPGTRSSYLEQLGAELRVQAARRNAIGGETTFAIFPYDPIAWTLVSRTSGDDAVGNTTIRLSPSCLLAFDWQVRETPSMAARNSEFHAAVDAVRTFAEQDAYSDFVLERPVPAAWLTLLVGFLAPAIASAALIFILKHMLFLGRPSWIPRASAAAVIGASAVGLYLQVGSGAEFLSSMTYLNAIALLTISMLFAGVAVVLGNQKALLGAFSVSVVAGISMAAAAYLGWTPDTLTSAAIAFAVALFGALGLAAWQVEANVALRRRTVRSA